MSEDSFGIGCVGAGFIAEESHIPSVEYLPEVHIAGIQNRTLSNAEALAEECRSAGWGEPSVYGENEVADLVADPAVDGLWITTPNFVRLDIVEAAINAVEEGATLQGIAIEKPIARSLETARQIIDRIESVDIPHAYLENWTHEPDISDMKNILWERGREAGRPYIARSQAEHGGPHSGWFWDGNKQGGGALTDMLCHALAANEVLLTDPAGGSLKPVSVSADTDTLKWNQPEYADELQAEYGVDLQENPVDDYARATIRYEDEEGRPVISEATGSWCYVGSGVRRQIELLGPEYSGQVVTDETSSSVFFSDKLSDGGEWAEKQNSTSGRMPVAAADVFNGGYVTENRDAVQAFRNGENGSLDLHDGERFLRLCLAAYKSAETGEEVDLQSVDLTTYTPPPARK